MQTSDYCMTDILVGPSGQLTPFIHNVQKNIYEFMVLIISKMVFPCISVQGGDDGR